ncbi:hypothetical protein ABL78_6350 [Leptomonas seymouri]|uniref:Cornichon protein n=1 Tax=Leptomonas seymouri TaxID=5684 RepID=A0A0N0P3W0_LEPSE|nr:hypothetical protein ABL78_6350 [Leptomonas seymouri]|eukprot:KPI84589.1 hypothetical protein ABL78_6350 [Leptomonas seymouri]
MANFKRLLEALRLQFQWIPVLITDRSRHTRSDERRRAYLFVLLHFSFALVVCGHFMSVIASWVLAFVLQVGSMGLCLMHLALLEDYADRMSNPQEVEYSINPLVVAEVAVRSFACLQCILTHSWYLLLAGSIELFYDLYVAQQRSLLIDATTIWKEIGMFRTDGRIRAVYQVIMVFLAVLYLVVSLYNV